ncbi:MAG TPA: hypothetical protein VFD63_25215, partial [Pyrinomonadaceae bacterium]|nr:hypothetical protein [Pyrinomonadaceae bacterium]
TVGVGCRFAGGQYSSILTKKIFKKNLLSALNHSDRSRGQAENFPFKVTSFYSKAIPVQRCASPNSERPITKINVCGTLLAHGAGDHVVQTLSEVEMI